MSEVTVDSFLEHYGVKGMKWGVRKSRSELRKAAKDRARTEKFQKKYNLTEKEAQRRQRSAKTAQKNLAKKMAVRAAVGVGATVGAHALARHMGQQSVRNRSVSTLNSNPNSGVKVDLSRAQKLVGEFGSRPVPSSAIPMGPIGSTGGKRGSTKPRASTTKFIADMTKKHNETIRKANADLKAGYDKTQTPFALREFLKEWD